MTNEERQVYNKLEPHWRKEYDRYKELHPNWHHNQIMAKIAFDRKSDEVIEGGGKDVDPTNTKILSNIFEGVIDFLKRININGRITTIIEGALKTLKGMIYQGIKSLGNKLQDFLKTIWG